MARVLGEICVRLVDAPAVDFDQSKILSFGVSGIMRRWPFRGYENEVDMIKYHILEPGEALPKLAKKYGVSVQKLKEWNHIVIPKNEMYIEG